MLRFLMVEAAPVTVHSLPEWRSKYLHLIARSQPAAVLPLDSPDHPLRSPKHVSDLLADSLNRLRRGQLGPRVANAMGYLASVLLRALEQVQWKSG